MYNTIASIEIALERESININYKLIAGLYNYFVAYTIDKYPIFYPYFFLFPKGNKQKGLNQLETCKNSKDIFIYTEANYFLMKINLEFENNYELANNYSTILTEKYDNNLLFQYFKMTKVCWLKPASPACIGLGVIHFLVIHISSNNNSVVMFNIFERLSL